MAHTDLTAEFFGSPVSIIDHANQRWITAEEAGHCLGYAKADAGSGIRKLYNRHEDEFAEADACRVSLSRQGQRRESLIFSATGCQKLGFFANTARAKDFRTWAARVLAGNAVPPAPTSADARLDRLDAHMAKLAEGMDVVLDQLNVTRKYIGLLELNQTGKRKMTEAVRRQIAALSAEGMNNTDIARLLRVSRTAVSLYLAGKYHPLPAPADAAQPAAGEIIERWIEREQSALARRLGAPITAEG